MARPRKTSINMDAKSQVNRIRNINRDADLLISGHERIAINTLKELGLYNTKTGLIKRSPKQLEKVLSDKSLKRKYETAVSSIEDFLKDANEVKQKYHNRVQEQLKADYESGKLAFDPTKSYAQLREEQRKIGKDYNFDTSIGASGYVFRNNVTDISKNIRGILSHIGSLKDKAQKEAGLTSSQLFDSVLEAIKNSAIDGQEYYNRIQNARRITIDAFENKMLMTTLLYVEGKINVKEYEELSLYVEGKIGINDLSTKLKKLI